ncbi:MAG: trigger factor [Planctomycetes bacterium]|jgi:trigger factor|nr:trigger factor [Planctomycetota bacterium]
MQVQRKELEKSQIELTVELSNEELKPFIEKGVQVLSEQVKIDGFRPGKVPLEILKQKVGEMAILEEAAQIAIRKTIDEAVSQIKDKQVVGNPNITITKLAPNNPLEYRMVLTILPEVKLGKYKELGIKKLEVKVDEKELDKALNELGELRAKEVLVDREAKQGDKVIVKIEMFLDKVPVEGGQAQDATIVIGKDYLIPGFDKQIIGAKKGEEKKFNLVYPENHHQQMLSGKLVDFVVVIKEVYERQLPEVNDEFAKELKFSNLEDLRGVIRKNISDDQKAKNDQKIEVELLTQLVKNTTFGEIPEILVQSEAEKMLGELEHSLSHQGANIDDYLNNLKKTRAQLLLDFVPDAIFRVKNALVIREVSSQEKIVVSEKEIEDKIEELKKHYQHDEKAQQALKERGYKSYLYNILTSQKVIDKLKEWNLE